jgi:anti-anti-sigma regulatory factor
MKLTYKPLANDEILRVTAEGVVSLRGKPANTDPLLELLGPHCYRSRVILSMERADGVDTSGIIWLVRTANRFTPDRGRFVVYGVSPVVRQMLDILGMSGLVPTAANEQHAVDAVVKPTADPHVSENGSRRNGPRSFSGPGSPAAE